MELRHLRYFCAVAEELSFSRAAARLHTSQPPLSRQIRDLEGELGTPLFHRNHNRIQLTFAGRMFLHEAREVLARAEHALDIARRAARGEIGELHISQAGGFAHNILPRSVKAFRRRFPGVAVHVVELSGAEQHRALLDGRIDLGFAPTVYAGRMPSFSHRPFARYAPVLVLPGNHHLVAERRVDLRKLADEKFIALRRQLFPGYLPWLRKMCRRASFQPDVVQETENARELLTLVAAGYGIGIVAEPLQTSAIEGLTFRPLIPVSKVTFSIVWSKTNASATAMNFLKQVPRLASEESRSVDVKSARTPAAPRRRQ